MTEDKQTEEKHDETEREKDIVTGDQHDETEQEKDIVTEEKHNETEPEKEIVTEDKDGETEPKKDKQTEEKDGENEPKKDIVTEDKENSGSEMEGFSCADDKADSNGTGTGNSNVAKEMLLNQVKEDFTQVFKQKVTTEGVKNHLKHSKKVTKYWLLGLTENCPQ